MKTDLMSEGVTGAIGAGVVGTTATGRGGGTYAGPWCDTRTPESAGRFLTDLMASYGERNMNEESLRVHHPPTVLTDLNRQIRSNEHRLGLQYPIALIVGDVVLLPEIPGGINPRIGP